VAGCTTTSVRKGLCAKHGGGPGECVIGGCTNQMVSMWTTCSAHGGKGYVHGRKRGEVIWLKVKEKNMLASNIDNKNLTRSARSSFFNNLLK